MMNCKQATQLMSQEMDRELSWHERLALKLHVLMCDGCANFRNQMAFLRRACQMRSNDER
ncbi:MAG: zf-HC2 domain-containing protein [Candidatus Thiodiazotropha sp.]